MNNNIQKFINAVIDNKKNLKKDLPALIKGNKKIKKGVYLGKNVKVEPGVFFDASEGDIFVGEGSKIKANSILRGPLIIGKNCVINSFADISSSRIGNVCKIGGEVSDSVIGDYSNKQHYGSLGYSYVGSWVNIGGGTSVASLKNTYSSIFVKGIDTKQTFMGAIIGDHVKTAINTSIFCGKVIGTSAHLYGTVTEDVPAFTSHVRAGVLCEIPFEVSVKIAKAMMQRRGVEFNKKDAEDLHKEFVETQKERKSAKVKKGKLSFK